MNASYRLGLSAVAWTVVLSAAACLATVGPRPGPDRPAGQDLSAAPNRLGAFRLTERSGRTVTEADLADRVWIASFIFTRCPASCPRISAVMRGLQGQLAGSGVRLVSLSVDPEHDTPPVLAAYAARFGADPDRWWFLTGPKSALYALILDRFHLGVAESSESDRQAGAEAVSHSARLALVDRGNRVVGYFDSGDAGALRDLVVRAKSLDAQRARRPVPAWARRLPAVNASLNGTCAALLVAGWALIRRGRVRAHVTCMAAGVAVSALFLGCYLVYHYFAGSVAFRGQGPVRTVYFTVLLSHSLLAAAVVPLAAVTVARALRRRWKEHAQIARVTFPIWLYVSITGVVVYWMLYHLVPSSPGL